jgi:phosphopantothenoylcysteine decarboxylase/phosphopantothenate--cysteine ligase
MKKDGSGRPPALALVENPDILRTVGHLPRGERPRLVVGFAAETDDVEANGRAKLGRKGADWIVANDVSPETGIMGGSENAAILITPGGAEHWPRLSKVETARRLADRIAAALA